MSVESKENKTDTPAPTASTTAATTTTTTTTATSTSTTPTTTDNVWASLLKKALRKNKENNSTLVVMGVPKSGKSSLLTKFSDRIVNENSNEYLLQYSYLLVKNKYAADKDDVLAHMNIWQLDDLQQLSILPLLLTGTPATAVADTATALATIQNTNKAATETQPSATSTTLSSSTSNPTLNESTSQSQLHGPLTVSSDAAATLDNTVYVVVIDLSSPATILTELTSWLQGVKLVTDRTMALLTPDQQQQFKTKIARHVQNYYANLSNSTTATTGLTVTPAADAAATTDTTVAPDIPPINLGIPVIIVGTKADTFTRKTTKPTDKASTATVTATSGAGGDERFEFITRRLRKIALQYGAGLIYTSSAGRGTSIDTLQAYLLHRLYHFPYPHPAKVVGSEDDWTIQIPSGADNADLIDSVSSVPTKSGWDDNTPFETIFASHKRRASTVVNTSSINSATSVRALDNVLFFKNLKVQLEQGPQRRDEALRDIVHAQVKSRTSMERQSSAGSSSTIPSSSPSNATSTSTSSSASAAAKAKAAASKPKLNPKGQIAVKQFFRSLLTNNPKSDATKSAQKTVRANAEQAIASMAEGNEESEETHTNEAEAEAEADEAH